MSAPAGVTVVVEPNPTSFAPRTADELFSTIETLGLSAVREREGSYRVDHPELGALRLGVEEDGGALRRLRLDAAVSRASLLSFAAALAGPLHWDVVNPASGERFQPRQLAARGATAFDRILRRSRAALTAIGALLAVAGGLTWRVQGGGQSIWLVVAVVGLCLYFGLRASAWIGSKLRHPSQGR